MSMKFFETDGTRNGLNVYCPICDTTCPYCDKDGLCHVADPLEDCTDFGAYYNSWEEYENSCDYDIDYDVDETGFNPYEGAYDYNC